jgi:hypothetical protein
MTVDAVISDMNVFPLVRLAYKAGCIQNIY